MTFLEFKKRYEEILETAKEIQMDKQVHYGDVTDAHESFKAVAEITGDKLTQVAFVLLAKHIASVKKLIASGEYDSDIWMEKTVDIINYMILIQTLIEDL